MGVSEKVVVRLNDGGLLKGYLRDFSPALPELSFEEDGTAGTRPVKLEDVKAVFFVKSFEGDRGYREKKSYGYTPVKGQRVFVKFNDGESLVGFLEGDVPWEKGFFLSRQRSLKGFYLLPADEDANNTKIFVVASSVDDATVVPAQAEKT
jgi:small nuclear ribonucleoprotein (snRNP)-like protein